MIPMIRHLYDHIRIIGIEGLSLHKTCKNILVGNAFLYNLSKDNLSMLGFLI